MTVTSVFTRSSVAVRIRRTVAPLAVGLMAVSGLALGPPAAADTLSYPYEVSSSSSLAADWTTPNAVALTGGTDDGVGTVALPFPVNLFGHDYPQGYPVSVSVNGTVQFGTSTTAYTNTPLPTASFDGPTLMPFWDDFDVTPTGQGEGIWWGTSGTAPNRTFAVKWRGYLHNSVPKRRIEFNFVTYEMAASTFVFSYFRAPTDPMADGGTATIGMQEGGSTGQFAQFGYDLPLLVPGLGIMFTSKRPEISGSPLVTGQTAEGQTLSATSGTWTPAGAMAYSYQWKRCVQTECFTYSDIAGATTAMYQLRADDVGKKIFVAVRARNGWGFADDWAYSPSVGPVTLGKPVNLTAPVLSGTPSVGSTVTVTNGTWTGSPTSFAYEWWRCLPIGGGACAPSKIAGAASNTYVLTAAELTGTVYVKVTATNGSGSDFSVSNSVGQVTVAKPVNVTAPVLSGTPAVGSTVSVTNGTWTGSPTSFAYEWWRCIPRGGGGCAPSKIAGAVSNTYVLTAAELTGTVYVKVTATNDGGSASAVSNSVGPVTVAKPANVTAPVLTGTPEVGSTVSVTNGTWSGSPTSFAYEWWRCIPSGGGGCAPSKIAGAASNTYVLTAAELTGTVYVKVTATNDGGSASAVSSSVGPVTEAGAAEPPPGDGDDGDGDNPPIQPVPKPSLDITGKPSVFKKGKKLVVSAGLRGVCPAGQQSCSLSLVGTAKIRKSVTIGRHTVTVQPGDTARATFVMRSKGMSALRTKGHLRVKLVATLHSPGSEQVTSTRTFTLRKPAWLN